MANVRRRARTQQTGRITADAVAAFIAGDRMELSRALRLPPWQISPLDVAGPCPYPPTTAGGSTWPDSVKLRAELVEAQA